MSLYYFKSEEDTIKNEIFLRLYIDTPPHTHTRLRKNICLQNILKSFTNYFSLYAYYCIFLNYKIIIDRILDIILGIYLPTKTNYNKNNLSNTKKKKKSFVYRLVHTHVHTQVHTLIARHTLIWPNIHTDSC